MPNEMGEFMKRAACHEAGHIIVAFKLGIRVEGVREANGLLLTEVWADDLDSTSRPAMKRYTFLAGGIAGEKFIFGDFDPQGMQDDQTKIAQRNGVGIEIYLFEALAIVSANKSCFDRIRKQLTNNWIAARAETQFCSDSDCDSDSYTILSRSDLDDILSVC